LIDYPLFKVLRPPFTPPFAARNVVS
jgi:hypothetical protein